MKAFLLTLNVDIPCKEEIHSLIKIFSYCENHSSLIEKLSLGLKSNSKGLVFNGLKEVISDFYLLEKIDDLANSNMRCDSLKSLMIINKLSK
ncbi:hypothetical protein, partial [Acinetobacter baumannii]|uniref:hypothetical protein n=1 Tax=Acinetobacter baumannii TaxID=470 RepID=UPI000466D0EC